ncbi:putative membrane protein [Kitasatospora sp. MAA19]|uniref:anthrone oxygenase family protein n=1 Tax=unclassified Kitasatospora TaxID=2633591 RepID=UPI0024735EA2|nr:anthrone oxygenase family protein [Kitasatospora sp. MAA19]MDH6706514.1 putative membrane protein [Kitasatospora sp. MAA19]
MELARTLVLVAATVTCGLTAGLFYAYACSVMPALARVEDRAFIEVMQRVNVAILNGWFVLGFVGALLSTGAAVALHLPSDGHHALPATIAALVLYVAAIGVTRSVNIPLNDELAAAGEPKRITDPAGVRSRFEARWVRFNVLRALLCTAALGCLAWALILHGQA